MVGLLLLIIGTGVMTVSALADYYISRDKEISEEELSIDLDPNEISDRDDYPAIGTGASDGPLAKRIINAGYATAFGFQLAGALVYFQIV